MRSVSLTFLLMQTSSIIHTQVCKLLQSSWRLIQDSFLSNFVHSVNTPHPCRRGENLESTFTFWGRAETKMWFLVTNLLEVELSCPTPECSELWLLLTVSSVWTHFRFPLGSWLFLVSWGLLLWPEETKCSCSPRQWSHRGISDLVDVLWD